MSQEDAIAINRRNAAKRNARWRARQSQETLDRIRAAKRAAYFKSRSLEIAAMEYLKRNQETLKETERRSIADAETNRGKDRDSDTCSKLSYFADSINKSRLLESERYKNKCKKRSQQRYQLKYHRHREQATLEHRDASRNADAERHRLIRENETLEQAHSRRHADNERYKCRRNQETLEERESRRKADAEKHRLIRENETPSSQDTDDERDQNRHYEETLEDADSYSKAVANIERGISNNETEILLILRSI